MKAAQIALALLLAGIPASAQLTQVVVLTPPNTRLEALAAQTGTVVVSRSAQIGRVHGAPGEVAVEVLELDDAVSGKKLFGIRVALKKGDTATPDSVSFVDADEIDPLLKGIDTIANVRPATTSLKIFHADYRTKGDLILSTFSNEKGDLGAAITSGTLEPTRVPLSRDGLAQLRAFVAQAKATIDATQ